MTVTVTRRRSAWLLGQVRFRSLAGQLNLRLDRPGRGPPSAGDSEPTLAAGFPGLAAAPPGGLPRLQVTGRRPENQGRSERGRAGP